MSLNEIEKKNYTKQKKNMQDFLKKLFPFSKKARQRAAHRQKNRTHTDSESTT